VLFLSKFSWFSIFSREVYVFAGLGSTYCWALATPSATSWTSSCSVIVGCWSFGEEDRGDGVGGSGGDVGSVGGVEGGPLLSALCSFLQPRDVAWPIGLAGTAGGRIFLVGGEKGSWMGLRRGSQFGSGGGVFVGALVLGGLTGLHQSCRGFGVGALGFGDPGRGIWVAIRRISSHVCHNSSSTLVIFLWWSAAHSSTLP